MDIQKLEAFYMVAKEKNFHKAAENLHITQPAISTRISSLEKSLNAPLFHRDGKMVHLTEFGEVLLGYAERILALLAEAETAVTHAYESEKNYIKIGTTNQISTYILPSLLKGFTEKYPAIDMNVQTNTSKKLLELLGDRFIHVALINAKPDHPDYECVLLDQNRIVLAASPEHTLYYHYQKHRHLSVEQFNKFTIININKNTSFYRSLFALFDEYGIQPCQYITVDSLEAMKKMTIANLGVGFFPTLTVQKELDEGELYEIPFLPERPLYINTYLVYRKNRYLNSAGQKFLAFTKEHFQRLTT